MVRRAVGALLYLVVIAVANLAAASGGWYLLIPPRSEYNERATFLSGFRILTEEPLSRWLQEGAYDSAADCEGAKAALTLVEHRSFELSADEYRKSLSADPKALGRGADGEWFNVTLAKHKRFTAENYNASVDALSAARCIRSDDPRLRR
jgi:hypothetical protein